MTRIFTLDKIAEVAGAVAEYAKEFQVMAFNGEMGAGKTTFITALCTALGVKGSISSPTYSIINQYETVGGKTIYHMDWYRLKSADEAIATGVEEPLYSGDLCLVEWPQNASALLPEDTLRITIRVLDSRTRELIVDVKN